MSGHLLKLPGGRIGTTARDYPRALLGSARFLGTEARKLIWQASRGDRKSLHEAERRWAAGTRAYLELNLETAGLHHIDPSSPYIVMPLHEGFADAIALLSLPLDLAWLARDDLLEWPLLGRYLSVSAQPIHYEGGDLADKRRLYQRVGEILRSGESLVVFPQGTILGIETAFRAGGFRLARAFAVPILPVVLTGSHLVWEYPYTSRLRFGQRMSLQVLPPVSAEQATPAVLSQRMKEIALDQSLAPPRRFQPRQDGFWDGYDYEIDPAFPELKAEIDRHRAQATP